MTLVDLAWIILTYPLLAGIWDIIDPDAYKLKVKPVRLLIAATVQVFALIVVFNVVTVSATFIVAYSLVFVILALLKLLIHGDDA